MSDFSVDSSTSAGIFLGVAPVQFASGLSLAPLKESDISLKKIGSYFSDAKMLFAGQATKNSFLRQYSKYTIIQLYTHASDSSNSGEPVIYFADSSLYLSDLIAENKPFTKLIVLSACETGNGKLYQGEGVFSFNREFASLGIPSSIANLWAVDNRATYKLTEHFYKYLSEGLPVDIALQKAKLEFMDISKEYRLPYYWAAAVSVGKTEALTYKKANTWKYLVAILVMAALSFFGLKKWANSKKIILNREI
jgi:CHAT domain-containing protein